MNDHKTVSPVKAGAAMRCPRCAKGKLYDGFLTVAERCSVCGLNLGAHDSGDGPAVFVILILGFVVVGLAIWLEFTFFPPIWVHMLLWPPLILGGALLLLRLLKGILIGLQYKHNVDDYAQEDDGEQEQR